MVFSGYKWWNWPYTYQNIKDQITFLNDLLVKPNCIKPNPEHGCDNLWPSTSFLFGEIKNAKGFPKEQHPLMFLSVKMLVLNTNKDISKGHEMIFKMTSQMALQSPLPHWKVEKQGTISLWISFSEAKTHSKSAVRKPGKVQYNLWRSQSCKTLGLECFKLYWNWMHRMSSSRYTLGTDFTVTKNNIKKYFSDA